MNEIADLPTSAFTRAPWKKRPQTLEGGGGGKSPKPPEPAAPPKQTSKAPQAQVYKDRAQSAGKGGMSAGYQSTLMTGAQGVPSDFVTGALVGKTMPQAGAVYNRGTLG